MLMQIAQIRENKSPKSTIPPQPQQMLLQDSQQTHLFDDPKLDMYKLKEQVCLLG